MRHPMDLAISDQVFDQQPIGLAVNTEPSFRVNQVLAFGSRRKAIGEY